MNIKDYFSVFQRYNREERNITVHILLYVSSTSFTRQHSRSESVNQRPCTFHILNTVTKLHSKGDWINLQYQQECTGEFITGISANTVDYWSS